MSWLQGPGLGKLRRHGERNGDQNRKRLGLSHRKTSFDARNRQVRPRSRLLGGHA